MVRTPRLAANDPAAKTLGQEIESLADDLARSGGTAAGRKELAARLKTLAGRADTARSPKAVVGGTAESPGPCLF
jgi:hypothetical protein